MSSLFTPERPIAAALGAVLFSVGILASLLGAGAPTRVHAAGACRLDPIVTLTNGLVVDLSATVVDTPSDIRSVAYTIHAPAGTSVLSVVYPPDPTNIPQTFQFYADNPAGTWDSYTYVDTMTSGISVTATAAVNGLLVFTATGLDHQQVHVHVQQGGAGSGQGSPGSGHDSAPSK